MNIIRGFISILGSKLGGLLLAAVITPLLVRLLGSSLYGDYAFLLSVLGITMILVNAGIFDGVRKYIAEERTEPQWVEKVFGYYLRVAVALAVIAFIVIVGFSRFGFVERFLGTEFEVYFYLLGLLVVIRQANSIARGGLMGIGLENRSEPLAVLRNVLFGVSALCLLYFGYGIVGVLIGHIVATIICAIFGYAIFLKHVEARAVFTHIPSEFPKRELLSFNGLSIVFLLLTASLYHVDILLLRLITGNQATGYYQAALVVAEFLWFVPNALQMVLLHSSSELWSQNRLDRITGLASKTTRYNLILVLLLMIGLGVLAPDFLPLYFGAEFQASVLPLWLLLPGALGFALARPIFAISQGKGNLRVLIITTGVAAGVNAVLNFVLIPSYGMIGAATATSIGYGLMVVLHILAAQKMGFNPIQDLRLGRVAILAIVSTVIIYGTGTIIESSIISLIVVPPLGFAIYSILAFRLRIITAEEIQPFTSRLPESLKASLDSVIQTFQ